MFCLRRLGRRTTIRRRLADERGVSLIEIVISAAVLGTLSVGVMSGFDVAARTSGDQKHKAAAANIAENELERMRSMRIQELTALSQTPQTVSQNGVTFTRTAKAEWVSQPVTGSICNVSGPPTYLRLSVSVSWPGRSTKPVTVTSLLAPGARGTLSSQGALVIRITDINGAGVGGVPVNLGGGIPQGTTDSNGCVSWSPLTAGTYAMTFSRSGYVTNDGQTSVSDSISVPGQQVTQRAYTYSQGATLSGTFYSMVGAQQRASSPTKVSIAHPSRSTKVVTVSNGSFSTTVVPDPNPYTIFAGGCESARPPSAPTNYQTTATVNPGESESVSVRMPALDPQTSIAGNSADGVVTVTDVCGDTYSRDTTAGSGGRLTDPGFPYSNSNLSVCGQVTVTSQTFWNGLFTLSNGNYRKRVNVPNNNWGGAGSSPGAVDTGDFNLTSYWFIFAQPSNGFSKASCP